MHKKGMCVMATFLGVCRGCMKEVNEVTMRRALMLCSDVQGLSNEILKWRQCT